MQKIIEHIRKTVEKIWEGVLQNVGTVIFAFIFSGGYLIIVNKVQNVQAWVRKIPSDYILTPSILLIVLVAVLWRVNKKQRLKLNDFERQPPTNDKKAKYITHLGVWWKIYFDDE